jgi:hypothetical protein
MIKKISAFVVVLAFFAILIPCTTNAAFAGLVSNCNTGSVVNSANTGLGTPCDFNALMLMVNNIIRFLLFTIATPLVALILCYAGYLMITSGGSSEKVTKVKHILYNVIIGYVIGLAAWLIVKTIMTTLGITDTTYTQFLKVGK